MFGLSKYSIIYIQQFTQTVIYPIIITIIIVIFIWTILGLAGLIWSIICFGKNDKTSLNAIGFLLALFLGPFYWLYYIFNKSHHLRVLI